MNFKYNLKTYGWIYTLITNPFNDFLLIPLNKIIKIIKWIPTLWKDRDWEDSDIFKILDFKLSMVEKVINEDTIHTDTKYRVNEIKEARKCIARILENDYCKKEQKIHDKKFGKLKTIFEKPLDGSRLGRIIFKPDSKKSRNSYYKIYKLEDERRNKDFDILFKILKEKSGGWWV